MSNITKNEMTLRSIRGKDVPEVARRIVRDLMANSFALKMNFVGRDDKVGIVDFEDTQSHHSSVRHLHVLFILIVLHANL